MKLVYLDNCQIALLARANEKDPSKVDEFVEKWTSSKFALALSQIHIAEIAGHNSEEVRNSRYKLLSKFLPFRFESGTYFEKEILMALASKGLLRFEPRLEIFSNIVTTIKEVHELRSFGNNPQIMEMLRLNSKAHSLSWEAEKFREFRKDGKKRRLRDIPDDSSFNSNFEELKQELITFKEEIKQEFAEETRHSFDVGFDNIISIASEFHQKAEETGYLRSISELFGIDLESPNIGRTPIEDIFDNYKFKVFATQTSMNKDIPLELILSNVSWSDCPSLWLANELRKNLSRAGDVSPSNEYDLEQIQYLRFVDLFFADKRIAEKTSKILDKETVPPILRNVPKPIRVPNSLESLTTALFSDCNR